MRKVFHTMLAFIESLFGLLAAMTFTFWGLGLSSDIHSVTVNAMFLYLVGSVVFAFTSGWLMRSRCERQKQTGHTVINTRGM